MFWLYPNRTFKPNLAFQYIHCVVSVIGVYIERNFRLTLLVILSGQRSVEALKNKCLRWKPNFIVHSLLIAPLLIQLEILIPCKSSRIFYFIIHRLLLERIIKPWARPLSKLSVELFQLLVPRLTGTKCCIKMLLLSWSIKLTSEIIMSVLFTTKFWAVLLLIIR